SCLAHKPENTAVLRCLSAAIHSAGSPAQAAAGPIGGDVPDARPRARQWMGTIGRPSAPPTRQQRPPAEPSVGQPADRSRTWACDRSTELDSFWLTVGGYTTPRSSPRKRESPVFCVKWADGGLWICGQAWLPTTPQALHPFADGFVMHVSR